MAGSATLNVAVLVNAAQAAAGFNQVSDKAESTGSKMTKAFAGLVAGAGLVSFAKDAVASLSRIETINAQSAQTIKSTGGAANVSAGHVEELALQIEELTATEAESVQEGANLLLTFTNIQNRAGEGNDVFDQATQTLVDMSRALGGDVASSAVQLGKALNDPIKGISALQKVGVTFTADQKNLIQSLVETGDVAGAQKVILAELNKEFGGSGAAYAETAAGQFDKFNDSVGDLGMSIVDDLMPALQAVTAIGTTAFGWLGSLPESVQVATLAFGGWLAFGDKITTFGSKITKSFREAEGASGKFKSVLSSIGPALGVAAIVGAAAYIATSWQSSMKEMADGVKVVQSAVQALGDDLVTTGGQATDSFAKLRTSTIENSAGFQALLGAGISYGDAMHYFTDQSLLGADATDAVTGAISDMDPALAAQTMAMAHVTELSEKYAREKLDSIAADKAAAEASMTVADRLAEQAKQQQAAISDVDALGRAYEDLKAATETAAKTTTLQKTLDGISTAASTAQRNMGFFNSEIDAFTGRNADVDKAALAFQKLLLGPTGDEVSAWGKYSSAAGDAVQALNDFNLEAIGGSAVGQDFMSQLYSIKDAYDAHNSAAYQAALKTGDAASAIAELAKSSKHDHDAFITWAKPLQDAGVDVEALARKLGILDLTTLQPKFLKVVTEDEEAQAALAALSAVQIDPATIEVVFDDPSTEPIESAITYVDKLTGLTKTIPLAADPKSANDVVQAVIKDIEGKPPTPLKVGADPAPANATVSGLTGAIGKSVATFGLAANPSSATSTVNQTTGSVQSNPYAILRIFGNSVAATHAVDELIRDTNGRAATIAIRADTAPFYREWNALPSSRTVTVTVNEVKGTVVASAAPSMAAAPSLSRTAFGAPMSTSAAPTTNVNVTVTGAIDPDATARQIRALLTGRGRRSGGIAI